MSVNEVEEKNQTDNPGEGEQSDEKVKKSTDASQNAEAKKDSIKNTNNKEAAMAGKKESKKQDQLEGSETEKPIEDQLAPGVTLEPQNNEQANLGDMEDPVAVSKISVPTDDDEGEFLGDTEAVKELREFIDENKSKERDALKDPDLLKTGTEVAANFNKKLSFREMITLAVLTKYFLLYGMALIILKDAVKETGQNWIYYYKKHFIPVEFQNKLN
jgi:hypothetical protein